MKIRLLTALLLSLVLCQAAYAAKSASVEARGAFLKITDSEKPIGAPVDRDAPDVLYVRRASIVRASVIFTARSTEFRVILVTTGPISTSRFDDEKITVTNDARSYFYNFPSEASAVAFCDAIIAEQKG